jgi:preprotein translocase subunit SecG
MEQVIIVVHILLGLGIVGLILMQQGRGADAGAGFGGGASGSVFGAQGAASFLSRMTAILAALFFSTSLALAWVNGHKSGETVDFMSSPDAQQKASDLVIPKVETGVANPVDAIPQAENKLSSEIPVTQPPTALDVPPVQAPLAAESAATVNPTEEVKPETKEGLKAEKTEEVRSAEEKATESKPTEHHENKAVKKSKKKHTNK